MIAWEGCYGAGVTVQVVRCRWYGAGGTVQVLHGAGVTVQVLHGAGVTVQVLRCRCCGAGVAGAVPGVG